MSSSLHHKTPQNKPAPARTHNLGYKNSPDIKGTLNDKISSNYNPSSE